MHASVTSCLQWVASLVGSFVFNVFAGSIAHFLYQPNNIGLTRRRVGVSTMAAFSAGFRSQTRSSRLGRWRTATAVVASVLLAIAAFRTAGAVAEDASGARAAAHQHYLASTISSYQDLLGALALWFTNVTAAEKKWGTIAGLV
jgi:hypothetical protein